MLDIEADTARATVVGGQSPAHSTGSNTCPIKPTIRRPHENKAKIGDMVAVDAEIQDSCHATTLGTHIIDEKKKRIVDK